MTEDDRQRATQKHIAEVEQVSAAILERLQTIDRDNKQLTEDLEDAMHIIDRQGQLLDRVCDALKGPPPPLTRYSFHDLPELAAQMMDELKTLRAKHGDEKENGNG